MIDVSCPYCGMHQPVDETRAGREIYCQSCAAKFEVAEAAAAAAATGNAPALARADGEFHWEGCPVRRDQLGTWILGIVLLPVGVGLIFLGKALLHQYSRHYTITSTHIVTRHGILSVDTRQIAVKDIRSIEVQATLWQRMLGIRRVEISTAGTEGVDVALLGIPVEVAEAVQQLQLKQGHGHDD
jgi:membrane protein YdbS with pleckstrin-like domain